jgi:aspartate carbamoyltransferase catalytic subunit
LAADHFGGHVVNAGDGWHAHPTQALLDLYTLRETLGEERLRGAKVCIVGDVLHSRVARSNVWSLTAWGVDVWLTGPAVFLRGFEPWARAFAADRRLTVTGDLAAGIRDADAVMALRVQRERLEGAGAPSEAAYAARWGLTEDRLARHCNNAIVMHPGPVNEGVELPPDVAAGPRSVITRQVANGVAVRMAVLSLVAGTDDRQVDTPGASGA